MSVVGKYPFRQLHFATLRWVTWVSTALDRRFFLVGSECDPTSIWTTNPSLFGYGRQKQRDWTFCIRTCLYLNAGRSRSRLKNADNSIQNEWWKINVLDVCTTYVLDGRMRRREGGVGGDFDSGLPSTTTTRPFNDNLRGLLQRSKTTKLWNIFVNGSMSSFIGLGYNSTFL